MTTATAPGKLVIYGDYAVLNGAPAAAVAVDARACARVDIVASRESVYIDLGGGRAYDFVVDPDAGLTWLADTPGVRGTIVEAVLGAFNGLDALRGPMPALRISIDTDCFFARLDGRTEKLGLGSSAAALVALSGALVDALQVEIERDALRAVCHAAHCRMQGSRGSGIDIAAALYGGVVRVRRRSDESAATVRALSWPGGLSMLPIWSGRSASTPELLARFFAYRDAEPDAFAHYLRHLGTFAQQADDAWRKGTVGEILSALAGYDNALRTLDYDAGIGINIDAHERVRGIVEHHGAVYKTSGAGGGDFGIALSDSSEVIGRIAAEAAGAGFRLFERELGVDGLQTADWP